MMIEKLREKMEKYTPISSLEWQEISSKFFIEQLVKGELYHRYGNVCKHVNFVSQGSLRIYSYDQNRDEVTLDFAFPGMFVTVFKSFTLQTPSEESMMALEDTLLLSISYAEIQHLLHTYMPFRIFYQKLIEESMICLDRRSAVLQIFSAEEKYQWLLDNEKDIIQNVPLIYIASYLGISPETLSRIRRKMMLS